MYGEKLPGDGGDDIVYKDCVRCGTRNPAEEPNCASCTRTLSDAPLIVRDHITGELRRL